MPQWYQRPRSCPCPHQPECHRPERRAQAPCRVQVVRRLEGRPEVRPEHRPQWRLAPEPEGKPRRIMPSKAPSKNIISLSASMSQAAKSTRRLSPPSSLFRTRSVQKAGRAHRACQVPSCKARVTASVPSRKAQPFRPEPQAALCPRARRHHKQEQHNLTTQIQVVNSSESSATQHAKVTYTRAGVDTVFLLAPGESKALWIAGDKEGIGDKISIVEIFAPKPATT